MSTVIFFEIICPFLGPPHLTFPFLYFIFSLLRTVATFSQGPCLTFNRAGPRPVITHRHSALRGTTALATRLAPVAWVAAHRALATSRSVRLGARYEPVPLRARDRLSWVLPPCSAHRPACQCSRSQCYRSYSNRPRTVPPGFSPAAIIAVRRQAFFGNTRYVHPAFFGADSACDRGPCALSASLLIHVSLIQCRPLSGLESRAVSAWFQSIILAHAAAPVRAADTRRPAPGSAPRCPTVMVCVGSSGWGCHDGSRLPIVAAEPGAN